jgi:hypothetical protein
MMIEAAGAGAGLSFAPLVAGGVFTGFDALSLLNVMVWSVAKAFVVAKNCRPPWTLQQRHKLF